MHGVWVAMTAMVAHVFARERSAECHRERECVRARSEVSATEKLARAKHDYIIARRTSAASLSSTRASSVMARLNVA